jgi:HD-like signal output (HDOD) protein
MAASERSTEVRHELLDVAHLPPLATTATQLIEAIGDPDVELRTVARIIERDPPLAARILGLANAAFFAQTTPIVDIEQAIIRVLGFNMVKSLSLSIALAGSFKTKECKHFQLRNYWLHALGAAGLAAGVGRRLRDEAQRPADMLYLAGLLHNLGSLILVHLRPQAMDQVYATIATGDHAAALALERQLTGVDRWQAGQWLAFRWHLPEPVTHTLGQMANPAYAAKYLPILQVVRAARAWMLAKDDGAPIEFRVPDVAADLTDAVAEELNERWDELLGLANTLT